VAAAGRAEWPAEAVTAAALKAAVIPTMFNRRCNSTVVVDASDSQLHQDYNMGLRKSRLNPRIF
jgi:hypothetical protein